MTYSEEIKVNCEFGIHDCISFDETRVTDDFEECRAEFLEDIHEHMVMQEMEYYEIIDDLADYHEVQVTVHDDDGEVIANGWIKEV